MTPKLTDEELRDILARTVCGQAGVDWKHGLQPDTIHSMAAELLDLRAKMAKVPMWYEHTGLSSCLCPGCYR